MRCLLAAVIVIIFIANAFLYQVRYDELAVVTTWNKIKENSQPKAGVFFKWPWPIEQVKKYSKQLQCIQSPVIELQTRDQFVAMAQLSVFWRIDDASKFYLTLQQLDKAHDNLTALVVSKQNIISEYRFDQLVNRDKQKVKLAEIERRIATALTENLAELGYGISIEDVFFNRLMVPQSASKNIFNSMIATRQRLAKEIEAQAKAHANAYKSEARSRGDIILSFAQQRGDAIRLQAQKQLIDLFDIYQQAPEFATFLRKIEAMKAIYGERSKIILDANEMDTARLLFEGPVKPLPTKKN